MADDGADAARILLEGNQFGGEAQVGAEFEGAVLHQRLQQLLRDEETNGGADVAHAFVDVRDEPGEFLARQGFDRHDGAVLRELRFGLFADDGFEADGAQHLHGALADERGARMNGGAAVVFDGERRNAVMREEHGRGHADEAASGDEDGDFVVRHEFHGIA